LFYPERIQALTKEHGASGMADASDKDPERLLVRPQWSEPVFILF
jgi:hypothetical protein